MKMAKMILDGIAISYQNIPKSHDMPADGRYNEKRLLRTLEADKSEWEPGDKTVKYSFDSLLDLFHKLESQFIAIPNLITREELNYFDDYITKAAENKAVLNYVRKNKLPLYGKLDSELNCNLRPVPID